MGFPVSGAVPGMPVQAEFLQNGLTVWAGTAQVQGGGISGLESIVFASQPSLALSGQPPHYVPTLQRIRFAQVFGDYYASGVVVRATIASGGIPDTLSGGKASISGLAAPNGGFGGGYSGLAVPGGAVVNIQWQRFVTAPSTASASGYDAFSGATSGIVSGQNIGVILIGD